MKDERDHLSFSVGDNARILSIEQGERESERHEVMEMKETEILIRREGQVCTMKDNRTVVMSRRVDRVFYQERHL